MSISKEERERITKFAGTVDGQAARLMEFPEDHDTESRELASDAEALAGDTRTLLEALDTADSEKAELQQENQRLRDKVAELDDQVTDHEEELINLDRQRRGEE